MGGRRSLRIGVIAPPWMPVPPAGYGGTEMVLDTLCRGLTERGHRVTLFTLGEATCPVGRAFLFDHVDPHDMGSCRIELRHVAAAYDVLDGLDLVHDHTLAGLFLSQLHHVPTVTTNHCPFDEDLADLYGRVGRRVPVIAISRDQAARAPAIVSIAAVIHHGLDVGRYPFGERPRDDLVFLGRMSPDKGVDDAIRAARSVGRPLRIAAKMWAPEEHEYFREVVEPLLASDIEYVGEVDHDDKVRLLASAAALVNPIRWHEPFGLVMIEALACGTPVVATRRGAVPELVDDGITGYVADGPDQLVAALASIDRIDRHACRESAERRFSMDRMARDHEAFYRRVLDERRPTGDDATIDLTTPRPPGSPADRGPRPRSASPRP